MASTIARKSRIPQEMLLGIRNAEAASDLGWLRKELPDSSHSRTRTKQIIDQFDREQQAVKLWDIFFPYFT